MSQKITITFVSTTKIHLQELEKELNGVHLNDYTFKYSSSRIDSINDLQYDVLISPANSYGDLKGGIDMTYYRLLGRDKLAERVRQYIRTYADGEIHIGDYGIIPIGNADSLPTYLVLCPTMVIPMKLDGKGREAYLFTRAMLKAIRKLSKTIYANKDINVMCPIPCVGVGEMDHKLVAKQMRIAVQSMNGLGVVHAVNMSQKEEDENKFKLPNYYAIEKMQNMKYTYLDLTSV